MTDVVVTAGTWGDGLALEVTRPAGAAGAGKRPAVVFVNGVTPPPGRYRSPQPTPPEGEPMKPNPRTATLFFLVVMLGGASLGVRAAEPAATAPPAERPYVIEYYYKTKWGYADEFLRLFRKNHLPVLRKEIEMGRILQVTAAAPRYHATEDGRWDYRVTIVFRNAAVATDAFDPDVITKQLYPDQETFKREEQRRFEILLAHWDLPLKEVDLGR